LSSIEFAHGFPARVTLTFGQTTPLVQNEPKSHKGVATIVDLMKQRHWAAADHMAAAQGKIGRLMVKRRRSAVLNVGDLVWMDSRHTANDLFKLTVRWFGPSTVLDVNGTQATLDLPQSLGLAHRKLTYHVSRFLNHGILSWGSPMYAIAAIMGS